MPRVVDERELESIVAPVCAAQGVELVDVHHQSERDGAVLRVLIERPGAESSPKGVGGVTLDDCTNVSRALSAALDAHEDLIPGAYRLEVSSPGIERPLVKARDYERFTGREARVQMKRPVHERKHFTGTVVGVRADRVMLRDERGNDVELPLSDIQKAHLVYRF